MANTLSCKQGNRTSDLLALSLSHSRPQYKWVILDRNVYDRVVRGKKTKGHNEKIFRDGNMTKKFSYFSKV